MNLNQASRKIAIQQAKEKACKEMIEQINKGLALHMELVMLLVLHDKFGFGAKRCKKAITEFEEVWDAINKQEVTGLTLADVAELVKNEIGLIIEDDILKEITKYSEG